MVAWDNNETRGTLGLRGQQVGHHRTTRELLDDLERFTDVYQSRIGDLGGFVRSQGDAHFDVLASDERADVTGTIREDTGYCGFWMLDALEDAGKASLRERTITVLADPSPTVDEQLAADLTAAYSQRTRGVHRIPYDPAPVAGSVIDYAQLSEATRKAWLSACAAMATAL